MPLITWAVFSYVAGLLAGSSAVVTAPALVACVAVLALSAIGAAAAAPIAKRRFVAPFACALLAGAGVFVGRDVRTRDARCVSAGWVAHDWRAVRSATPCDAPAPDTPPSSLLERWRMRAGARIDTLFQSDAPLVRALLIADMRAIPAEMRDRFAAAGLIHILSISGLHVAIIAGAVLLGFEALRIPRSRARWAALGITVAYVAAIGAPPPAVRSAAMLAVATASRSLDRPVSPWAVLALGALIPLYDPRTAMNLGWQLSVAGFAALTAAGIWARRNLPRDLRGWRRTIARDLTVSILATIVSAPLVTWAFGRLSLIAPLTNIVASPVIALLQPMLFLALASGPAHGIAQFVAHAAHPLLYALDGIARMGAAVPHGSLSVAPTLGAAVALGGAAAALVVAAASRKHAAGGALIVCGICVSTAVWWSAAPAGSGLAELHMIDVGQGDAIAIRTPHGRWMLVDAGRIWNGGDAGRSIVVPYLRRFGGELSLFVLSHPHADHVGGAATVLRALQPAAYRDGAFAGGSESYRQSLNAASALGVAWSRVHPGDSLSIDGVSVTFLAPDSAWTARLHDPNLASTIALVQYGGVRFLLTGDAEAPEESWLLAHVAGDLHADVLKVGHHGSATSSSAAFLDAVHPRVALVSVGAGNSYGHPSESVMLDLISRGITVLRTDQLGTIVVRTDGRSLTVVAAERSWQIGSQSADNRKQ
ncbi:MAG TPA: DNA internalization-related competence protein ComEC/Rec2 [Gemmatimonadaceae bacterium]|nr:DNA internalization-related competence protein ComEC/Rec2 [Gemmatimonadaceae bacterium]